jgi:hypothetical protein
MSLTVIFCPTQHRCPLLPASSFIVLVPPPLPSFLYRAPLLNLTQLPSQVLMGTTMHQTVCGAALPLTLTYVQGWYLGSSAWSTITGR